MQVWIDCEGIISISQTAKWNLRKTLSQKKIVSFRLIRWDCVGCSASNTTRSHGAEIYFQGFSLKNYFFPLKITFAQIRILWQFFFSLFFWFWKITKTKRSLHRCSHSHSHSCSTISCIFSRFGGAIYSSFALHCNEMFREISFASEDFNF